jgi:hypothetical protein
VSDPKSTKAGDLAKSLGDFEVHELDDKDLEGASGGSLSGNTNCGCGGKEFSGGDDNLNCGCGSSSSSQ